jgi:hypothetical protein
MAPKRFNGTGDLMDKREDQYLGKFRIENRQLPGLVTLKGAASRLELYSDHPIHVPKERRRTIRGVARTGEKITICDAIPDSEGSQNYHGAQKHFASLFPHFVAVGSRHLDIDQKVVSEIIFTTSGAESLFNDSGAFGSLVVKNVKRLMPDWAKKDRRKIHFHKVFYYADRGPIISAFANNITFKVFNSVSYSSPSAEGIKLNNEVRIILQFKKFVVLADAIKSAFDFRIFCEILSQTKHVISHIQIRHKIATERGSPLDLFPSYEEAPPEIKIDHRETLISGGTDKKEFEKVLARWMDTQESHYDARMRITEGIREDSFTIDRLVGAANAFDLLPGNIYQTQKLPKNVVKALSKFKLEAKMLKSPFREQFLNNLGLMKGLRLRDKIEARFKSLPAGLKLHFPEMEFVIDHCVKSRNYFVHGTKPKLTIPRTREFMFFFTQSLEFIFVTSELVACGWKYERWLNYAPKGRFLWYLKSYEPMLDRLRST